jgi:hypothetical protein
MPEVDGSPIGELVAQSYVTSTPLCVLKIPFASLISESFINISPDATHNQAAQSKGMLELKK